MRVDLTVSHLCSTSELVLSAESQGSLVPWEGTFARIPLGQLVAFVHQRPRCQALSSASCRLCFSACPDEVSAHFFFPPPQAP